MTDNPQPHPRYKMEGDDDVFILASVGGPSDPAIHGPGSLKMSIVGPVLSLAACVEASRTHARHPGNTMREALVAKGPRPSSFPRLVCDLMLVQPLSSASARQARTA